MTISFGGHGFPPCWRAYFLLLRQKKVAKEKATPGAAPATPVPCATRNAGRLAKLACGSNNASRQPPAFLRCSAPSTGTPKASGLTISSQKTGFHGQPEKTAKNEIGHSGTQAQSRIVLPGPLRGAEQRRVWRIKGEDCLRAKPEFRSPRQSRVAQGTGAAGTDPGSPFLCLLSFGEAKESNAASKAEPQAKQHTKAN
ncbi:MAG: hypothetical protein KKE51_03330 [Gammaproteobacteria bacterium]|nr:hypothetical protein [Gammaproteobacteria bacterium]MBU1602137.1 hypothetical protein [Gammaproteobacteria bacterium]MBU2434184.1 hypothetical protein [Gammaproteobacteria bacterium]MBU2448492.1 hypothetical protein [Gammaproteobacteria bacterium]